MKVLRKVWVLVNHGHTKMLGQNVSVVVIGESQKKFRLCVGIFFFGKRFPFFGFFF
jgi:hypothetical protein